MRIGVKTPFCVSEQLAAYQDAIRQHDVPAGDLEVYDSNSWRRVGLKGKYKAVMAPCVASDGHPDIIGDNVLRALVAAYNAMPVALQAIERLEREKAEWARIAAQRNVSIALIAQERDRLRAEVAGYQAWERSVNEALNSGDGSYRP
jgi:hypothetical protein